jgi:hypothetical protein
MNLSERLSLFISKNFKNQQEFADAAGVDKNTISRYKGRKFNPNSNILLKFQDVGLSIDWLLNGIGIMYAKNNKGIRLAEKFIDANPIKVDKPFGRIKKWIFDNYGCLQNFVIINNLKYDDIYLTLYEDSIPDLNFIKVLHKSGCDPDWILTGSGSSFAENPMGELLQNQLIQELLLNKEGIKEKISNNILEQSIQYDAIMKIINLAMISSVNGHSNTTKKEGTNENNI